MIFDDSHSGVPGSSNAVAVMGALAELDLA
jgi:hypothetical protein